MNQLNLYFRKLLFPFLLLVCGESFAASEVDHLYQAWVPLADRSAQTRQAAFRQGLNDVLVKLSGYSGAGASAQTALASRNIETLVSEFGTEQLATVDSQGNYVGDAEHLWIRFSSQGVDQLLTELQLPIWPQRRNDLGLVVLLQSEFGTHWVTPENSLDVQGVTQQLARDRGVRVRVADASLRDTYQPFVDAITGLDAGTLRAIKRDMGVNDLLVITLAPNPLDPAPGHVRAMMQSLSADDQSSIAATQGLPMSLSIRTLFDAYVDELAIEGAFIRAAQGAKGVIEILVSNADNFGRYHAVVTFLRSLEQVQSVQLVAQNADAVRLRIRFDAGESTLVQGILGWGQLAQGTYPSNPEVWQSGANYYFRYPAATGETRVDLTPRVVNELP